MALCPALALFCLDPLLNAADDQTEWSNVTRRARDESFVFTGSSSVLYTTAVNRPEIVVPEAINTEKHRALSARSVHTVTVVRNSDAAAINTVTSLCQLQQQGL